MTYLFVLLLFVERVSEKESKSKTRKFMCKISAIRRFFIVINGRLVVFFWFLVCFCYLTGFSKRLR